MKEFASLFRRSRWGWSLGLVGVWLGLSAWFVLGCSGTAPSVEPGGVLVVAPENADPIVGRIVKQITEYLPKLGAEAPVVQRVSTTRWSDLLALAKRQRAGLVYVLDADVLATERFSKEERAQLTKDNFYLSTVDEGDWGNKLGSRGATFVLTLAQTKVTKQLVAYEFLRRLGARFYHPEQEFVPKNKPEQLRDRANSPTIVAQKKGNASSPWYNPDYSIRSFSFHGAHPLEHMEAFSDAKHPIDEAVRVNEWILKNRGNIFRGAGRGVATGKDRSKRVAELEKLRKELGFPRSAGISLHNEQQGANAVVDRSSKVPPRKQIEDYVTKRLKASPDAHEFGIHFGPTEFTVTPDKETIDWINWAGRKALELKPDILVVVNNHISGSQPMPNYDDFGCSAGTNSDGRIDYYDLVFHTDKRFAAKVHTVMFYPLEGPAFVYHQKTFAHKLCLMQKASEQGRPLLYFPEGSWWLSFDNPVPVYLPLYVWARWRDIELIKPLLQSRGKGTLYGHRMFNSGHEWGYWQQDYTVGLWHWNADISLEDASGELFDSFCKAEEWKTGCPARKEALAVFVAMMKHQKEFLLDKKDWKGVPGGLYAYLSGEDPADELGALTGFVFSPVRVSFQKVTRWDAKQVKAFRASDLAALDTMAKAYAGWSQRLKALRESIPDAGKVWFEEYLDGVEINRLRALQAHQLYNAVLMYRETQLANEKALEKDPKAEVKEPKKVAMPMWEEAAKTLKEVETTIRRREKAYRYPAKQMYGGGFTPKTAVPNGTTYPWRVHTKTHYLSYWKNRHEQVKQVLEGASNQNDLVLAPVFADPGEVLKIQWPKLSGLRSEVKLGDKALRISQTEFDLGNEEGFWKMTGKLVLSGRDIAMKGGVVRSKLRAKTPPKGMKLTKPKSSIAQSVLKTLFPAVQWAQLREKASLFVFGVDLRGDGKVPFPEVTATTLKVNGDSFQTAPVSFQMPIPDPATQEKIRELGLSQVVFEGKMEGSTWKGPLKMKGSMSVEDLAEALIELAGFEKEGAYKTLAGILGFDPKNPPKTVPFEAELQLETP